VRRPPALSRAAPRKVAREPQASAWQRMTMSAGDILPLGMWQLRCLIEGKVSSLGFTQVTPFSLSTIRTLKVVRAGTAMGVADARWTLFRSTAPHVALMCARHVRD